MTQCCCFSSTCVSMSIRLQNFMDWLLCQKKTKPFEKKPLLKSKKVIDEYLTSSDDQYILRIFYGSSQIWMYRLGPRVGVSKKVL